MKNTNTALININCAYAIFAEQITSSNREIEMEDKELKKRLAKIPDADKNGDPIYKIADLKTSEDKSENKLSENKKPTAFSTGVLNNES